MRLSTNISHWVCISMGVILIVTGLVSHAHRQAANAALPGDDTDAAAGVGKRAVLVAIGLIAVGYGVLRILY